jgi:flagella basal body P-ring formation protein FlgA
VVSVLAFATGLAPDSAFSQSAAGGPGFAGDLAAAPQVAAEASFVLRERAEVSGDRILVSDVASCEGAPAVCEETYGVYLGESPAPGRSTVLSADKISLLIVAEWPDLRFTLSGSRIVRVEAVQQEVREDAVAEALQQVIAQRFFSPADEAGNFRVALERLHTRGSFKLRPGDFQIVFPELTWDGDPVSMKRFFSSRQRRLRVEFVQDKSVIRDTVQAEFSVQEYLPASTRDLLRGEVVLSDDVRMAWLQTDRDAGSFVSTLPAIQGRRLKQSVLAGRAFETRFLEVPVVAKKGSAVRMLIRKGDMEIQGQVKLLANGGYGQVVDAQYLKTKKRVRVRIVDSETVQMVF